MSAYVKGKFFGGRDRELELISDWLSRKDVPPYMLVTAAAGKGKSALLVHVAQALLGSDINRTVVFVPVSARYNLNTEPAVLRAITSRLQLALLGTRLPQGELSVDDLRGELSHCLTQRLPDRKEVLLIIDGLDEATGWDVDAGLFPLNVAPDTKVLLSARTGLRDAARWRKQLGFDNDHAVGIEIYSLGVESVEALLHTAGISNNGDDLAAQIYRLTEGDPLLLSLYIDELKSDDRARRALAIIAPGLAGYMEHWWDDQLRIWGRNADELEQRTQAVLALLSAAFGPLPRRTLTDLLRLYSGEPKEDQLNSMLRSLARFVIADPNTHTYVLSHPKFAEYYFTQLREDGRDQKLDRLYIDLGFRDTSSSYLLRFLGAHLERSHAPTSDFVRLIDHNRRTAWEAVADEYDGYAFDVRTAWKYISVADREDVRISGTAAFLGSEVRCANDLAQSSEAVATIRPQMVRSLVQFGLWSPRRALSYLMRLENDQMRAKYYAELVGTLEPDDLKTAEAFLAILRQRKSFDDEWGLLQLLPPLCQRLAELGLFERALGLIETEPVGAARSAARLRTLSARADGERDSAIVKAVQDLRDEDWLDRYTVFSELDVRSDFSRAMAPSARNAALQEIRSWMDDSDDQYLRFTLHFVSPDDRAQIVGAVLSDASKREYILRMAILRDIAQFIPDNMLSEALMICLTSSSTLDAASATVAFFLRLNEIQKLQAKRLIALGVNAFSAHLNTDDQIAFLKGLCSADLPQFALSIVADALIQKDFRTADYLSAAAECLNRQHVVSLLRSESTVLFESARAVLLERLATFSARDAYSALEFLKKNDAELASTSSSAATILQCLDSESESQIHLAEWIATAECDVIVDIVIALGALGAKFTGEDAAIIAKGIQSSERSFIALRQVLLRIPDETIAHDSFLEAAGECARSTVGFGKFSTVVALFSKLLAVFPFEHVLNIARSWSNARFDFPVKCALVAFAHKVAGSGVGDRSLIAKILREARKLTGDLDDLIVFGALADVIGTRAWRDRWRRQREFWRRLEPSPIIYHGSLVSEMFSVSPAEVHEDFWREFSLDSLRDTLQGRSTSFVFVEGIAALIGHAPHTEVEKALELTRNYVSNYLRNPLWSACAIRLAELGDSSKSSETLELISDYDVLVQSLARIVPFAAEQDLAALVRLAYRGNDRDRGWLWMALTLRASSLSPLTSLGILQEWLEQVSRLTRKDLLRDLRGLAGVVRLVGGRETLREVYAMAMASNVNDLSP